MTMALKSATLAMRALYCATVMAAVAGVTGAMGAATCSCRPLPKSNGYNH
jgi:hypothetical protein